MDETTTMTNGSSGTKYVDVETFNKVVRRYFAEKEAREALQKLLEEFRTPTKPEDPKYLKGILCYLNKQFLPFSTKEGVAILYKDIRQYVLDYPEQFDTSRYLPAWASPRLKGYDLCRLFWGINKAVGYNIQIAGEFLKHVFPEHFVTMAAGTISANLTKVDYNSVIKPIDFNKLYPREYFERLYDMSRHEK